MAVDGAIIWMRILARNQYTPVKSEQLAYNMRTSFERRYGSPTDLSG
jgi:hypothetical protein